MQNTASPAAAVTRHAYKVKAAGIVPGMSTWPTGAPPRVTSRVLDSMIEAARSRTLYAEPGTMPVTIWQISPSPGSGEGRRLMAWIPTGGVSYVGFAVVVKTGPDGDRPGADVVTDLELS